jgi:hypothetical protein
MNGGRIPTKRYGKLLEMCGWNTAHQKRNLKADTNQANPLRQHWALGHIGQLTQEVMAWVADDGATLIMGGGGWPILQYTQFVIKTIQ